MIRTREDLYDRLTEELSWRKRELGAIKSLVRRKGFEERKRKAVLRSGLAVLYAHWEGYIKVASSAYLEFVKRRRLNYEDLSLNFVALGAKKETQKWAVSDKATLWKEVASFFMQNMSDRCALPDTIDTKSNLNSSVFKEVVASLGLSYSAFSTSEKLIDKRLVDRRNSIAHGDYLSLQKEDFLDVMRRIIVLMENFRDEIDNSVVQKHYRRAS